MTDTEPTPHENFNPPTPEPVSPPIDDPVVTGMEPHPVERQDAPNRTPLVIGAVLFLLLAAGEAWLFHAQGGASDQSSAIAALGKRVDALQSQLADLRSSQAKLDGKLAQIASQPAQAAPPPQVKVVDKIPAALGDQVNTIGDQIKTMQAGIASLTTTALADHASIASLQKNAGDLPKQVAKAQTLATLAQASLALQNGAPLGTIPGAPEALVRYATTPPPTLAGLQASFAFYADKAVAAAGTIAAAGGFWQRVKGRVESMVTIRNKDRVLVGSRAEGIIGAARADLDRDDLAATLADLKPLPAPAQAAMAPWTEQANRLLAARAALAQMAGAH